MPPKKEAKEKQVKGDEGAQSRRPWHPWGLPSFTNFAPSTTAEEVRYYKYEAYSGWNVDTPPDGP